MALGRIDSESPVDRAVRWQQRLEDGRLQCDLCPRHCRLHDGQRGFCFVRERVGDAIALSAYGRATGFCIDPIEKKPLNHFFPGTSVLSFGTAGCNLGCKFCQNWDISKARSVEALSEAATPEQIAAAAERAGCHSVAFTYNDPVIFAEYAIDTATACRARGIRSVAVTAGYITPHARGDFFRVMDAVNVDLKAFTENFYTKLCFADLGPVLDTLKFLRRETEVWLEVTTLLIPGHNDSPDEVDRLCEWFARELGSEVPLHFSAFHPDYRMADVPHTPKETLARAREQAKAHGLQHVYTGNVHDGQGQSTYCGSCSGLLIERDWYRLGAYHIEDGRCAHCGAKVPGRFARGGPGNWGPQRRRLTIAGS
ncbi:MAG TPA: AmmeMemoRadiSam system radical SAM enzyme [Polyangiaceae bacterium]|nr:AmmeMemoRadiSam system radical SAM enzyme [Polyangiaceae bacterium]